jgi:glycosyltransferase involved in cell wall biosynthesis
VVPCYNEEAVLPITAPEFLAELNAQIARGAIDARSQICFVNDGSTDKTWDIICALAAQNPAFCGISLSRNRGHQNALLAGLMEARGRADITISIDADGQDDIRAIGPMIDDYARGSDVVYGVRSSRQTDTAFKRMSAQAFYKMMDALGVQTVFNHADYRLLSARALDGLAQFPEANLYLRGMVPLVGFPSATVSYERHAREAGQSHYPLGKMLALAFDGITSLSVKPLHILAIVGIITSVVGVVGVIWALIVAAAGMSISGWASLVCIVCFFGGLQLLALGVIGEYVGKVYLEVKHRPRYIVAERVGLNGDNGGDEG